MTREDLKQTVAAKLGGTEAKSVVDALELLMMDIAMEAGEGFIPAPFRGLVDSGLRPLEQLAVSKTNEGLDAAAAALAGKPAAPAAPVASSAAPVAPVAKPAPAAIPPPPAPAAIPPPPAAVESILAQLRDLLTGKK